MTDEMKPPRPREPFLSLVDKSATPLHERLNKLELNSDLILKRMQQTALMVDGFGSSLAKRFDVLHQEAALLRAHVEGGKEDYPPVKKLGVKRAALLTGRWASYATLAAVVLRLLAKQWPQYGDAVNSVLGVFGL